MDYPELKRDDVMELAELAGVAPNTIYHFEAAFLRFADLLAKKLGAQRAAPQVEAAPVQQPVATLHDDGYYTFKRGQEPQGARYAGWRMDVYAAAQPVEVQLIELAKQYAEAQYNDDADGLAAREALLEFADKFYGIQPTGEKGGAA